MTERKRLYLLILIMTCVSLAVGGIAIYVLYGAAMGELRGRLSENAQSQARLIEAVARFDAVQSADFPQGPVAATISQIIDAHQHYKGFGRTGEFTLARREGEQIVFLLSHRHYDLENPKPVSWDAELAEPMRRALSGMSGTDTATDYRGETVLAAYEPVAELGLGIVAKIDLEEVRAPFERATLLGFVSAVVVVFFASLLFLRFSNPMVTHFQEEHARLDAILENAVDGIITIDQQGIIESFNPAAEQMFGHSIEDVIGQNIKMLIQAPGNKGHDNFLANYLQSGQKKIFGSGQGVVGVRKSGREFPMDLAVSEVRVGGRRLFTGIIRDITELKHAQERLVQGERLSAIGEAMTGLTHESRNALARSQANLRRLSRRLKGHPDLLALIDAATIAQEDVRQLFEDVRQYAAPIQLQCQLTDLGKLIDEVWEQIEPNREDRDVRLRQPDAALDLECEIDPFSMRNVLRNILENALAACEDPVEIDIDYSEVQTEGRQFLRILIRNNGPGLTIDQADRVFDSFYTTKTHGTGLGLAIVKRLVEQHGGNVSVSSNNHKGAEFALTLPRSQR